MELDFLLNKFKDEIKPLLDSRQLLLNDKSNWNEYDTYYESTFCQLSKEWMNIRNGIITSSVMYNFLYPREFDPSTELDKYKMYVGITEEDNIREWYSDRIGKQIRKAGAVVLKECNYFMGSPDGIIDENEIIEIKVTFKNKVTNIPSWHKYQMMCNMFYSNRKKCHYINYSVKDEDCFIDILEYDDKFLKEEILRKFLRKYLKM